MLNHFVYWIQLNSILIPNFDMGKIERILYVRNQIRDSNLLFISGCYTTRVLS